jgi:hypothetical protein
MTPLVSERDATSESKARPRLQRDPQALSTEYHKARKQLMLWAAILFIWELVGIDLDKAKDAEGYAGALIKSIKSPQAVPWVLTALVIYFLFKCSIEWGQCHVERRRLLLARIDFLSALIVSAAAIALYMVQAVSRVQFADVLQSKGSAIGGLAYGLLSAVLLFLAIFTTLVDRNRGRASKPSNRTIHLFFFGLSVVTLILGLLFPLSKFFLLLGVAIILVPATVFLLLKKRWPFVSARSTRTRGDKVSRASA